MTNCQFQATAASLVYLGLSQLGNPAPTTKRNDHTGGVFDTADIDRVADAGVVDSLVSTIDGVFTPAAAIRFLTLQTVLVS